MIARARKDFKAGRYRWVAQVANQVVFAEPSYKAARTLAADAFEQLGYLAESATWRIAYLLGAQEPADTVDRDDFVTFSTCDMTVRSATMHATLARMIRFLRLVLAAALTLFAPYSASARVKHYPLETTEGLRLHNVTTDPVVRQGKKGLRLTFSGDAAQFEKMTREEQAKAQERPTLIVNDLKSGAQGKGAVALWLDIGTTAHFRNLTVR